MRYLGGKVRLARHIVPVLNVQTDDVYVEPFVGGAAIMAAHSHVKTRIAGDAHPELIALHKAIQAGWVPDAEAVTKEYYEHVRDNRESYPPELVGYVGFCCSMHGAFFRGYIHTPKDSRQTNHVSYAQSGRNVLLKAKSRLHGVDFQHSSYENLDIPDGAIVYCDPPYENTEGYSLGQFSHDRFWDWASRLRDRCKVYVSELAAPTGWECIWAQERSRMGSGASKRRTVERVFV